MGFRTDIETGITYIPLKEKRPEARVKRSVPRVKLVGPVVPVSDLSPARARIIRAIYSAQELRRDPPLRRR